jgi:hypothetical protein
MLPRTSTLQVFGEENEAGYRPMLFWEIEPWYVASSKSSSWLYSAYTRFFALPVAGDAKFRPEGYKLQEIGPKHLEGKGGEDVLSFVKNNEARAFTTFGQFDNTVYTRSGCPMNFEERMTEGMRSEKLAGKAKAACPMVLAEKLKGQCPLDFTQAS